MSEYCSDTHCVVLSPGAIFLSCEVLEQQLEVSFCGPLSTADFFCFNNHVSAIE